jgi:hypothetical protein
LSGVVANGIWNHMHRIDAFTKCARVASIQGGPSGSPAVASFAGSVLRTGLRRRYDRCPEEEKKKKFRDWHESITPYPSNQRLGAGFSNGTATGCIRVSHQSIIFGPLVIIMQIKWTQQPIDLNAILVPIHRSTLMVTKMQDDPILKRLV